MNNELDFLLYNNMSNNDNRAGIFDTSFPLHSSGSNYSIVYKNSSVYGTTAIKNSIKNKVYNNDTDKNPYIKLIEDFNTKYYKSLRLKPSHFFYLKNIGVKPINKLIILRRFPEGVIVDHNLLKMRPAIEPISTVASWIDSDEREMFSFNFGESWTVETKLLDEVLNDILKNEFLKGGMESITGSVPGFSLGLLFGFYKRMNLTAGANVNDDTGGFDVNNIPKGNPNVLQEGATRDSDKFGLKSGIKIKFTVEYEQKFQSVNGVDPSIAFLEIIYNLLRMGTSDVKFVFNTNSAVIQSLITAANSQGRSSSEQFQAWKEFIKTTIVAFIGAIGDVLIAAKKYIIPKDNNNNNNNKQTITSDTKFENTEQGSFLKKIADVGEGVMGTIIASTIATYKWQLIGSIGAGTGINTTPWHLTIGNPYHTILSVGNVVVDDITVSFSNDLGFNDLPLYIKADINVRFGRNMGKQELYALFNRNYQRIYSTKTPPNSTTNTSNVKADLTNIKKP